jgi:hypothetical protein
MTDKQLLDQLLDACDMSDEEGVGHISTRYIRTLLGAAPVQEPVAIHQVYLDGGWVDRDVSEMWEYEFYKTRVVYTTPPAAQRQWVGLTKDQRDDFALQCGSYETVCAIEAKLKEKNT